ncbi:hypothetical protein T484DRAFT_1834356, partial [Baffinella frigidus]
AAATIAELLKDPAASLVARIRPHQAQEAAGERGRPALSSSAAASPYPPRTPTSMPTPSGHRALTPRGSEGDARVWGSGGTPDLNRSLSFNSVSEAADEEGERSAGFANLTSWAVLDDACARPTPLAVEVMAARMAADAALTRCNGVGGYSALKEYMYRLRARWSAAASVSSRQQRHSWMLSPKSGPLTNPSGTPLSRLDSLSRLSSGLESEATPRSPEDAPADVTFPTRWDATGGEGWNGTGGDGWHEVKDAVVACFAAVKVGAAVYGEYGRSAHLSVRNGFKNLVDNLAAEGYSLVITKEEDTHGKDDELPSSGTYVLVSPGLQTEASSRQDVESLLLELIARDFPAPTGRSYNHGHILVGKDTLGSYWLRHTASDNDTEDAEHGTAWKTIPEAGCTLSVHIAQAVARVEAPAKGKVRVQAFSRMDLDRQEQRGAKGEDTRGTVLQLELFKDAAQGGARSKEASTDKRGEA